MWYMFDSTTYSFSNKMKDTTIYYIYDRNRDIHLSVSPITINRYYIILLIINLTNYVFKNKVYHIFINRIFK
jgi:hypothetical protein